MGREKLKTIVFRMEGEGCPRRECQNDNFFVVEVVINVVAEDPVVGHS